MTSELPTDKIAKDLSQEYPKYDSNKYIWRNKINEYTDNEIEEIDADKIDFIYDEAIGALGEITDTIKSQQARISVLLGYLLILIAGILGYILNDGILRGIFEWCAFALAFGYSMIAKGLIKKLHHLFIDGQVIGSHILPKYLMEKSTFRADMKLMKAQMCKTLQLSAEHNTIILEKTFETLAISTTVFVRISLIAIIAAVINSLWMLF